MKDTDLRGMVLQHYYDHRKDGRVGVGAINGVGRPNLPEGIPEQEVMRISAQLSEAGLIAWHGLKHSSGSGFVGGYGTITAKGVDVIEGETESPLPIHIIDQSQHHQTINISGTQGGVQVGGAQGFEKLISAINNASVPDEAKRDAKSKLAGLLGTTVVTAMLGTGVKTLIEHCLK
jgi:hypothetical protein